MKLDKIKKAKTIKDILKDPRLAVNEVNNKVDFHSEEDGGTKSYWGYVKAGLQVDHNEQHTIHESTIKEFCRALNSVTLWENDPEIKSNNKVNVFDNN